MSTGTATEAAVLAVTVLFFSAGCYVTGSREHFIARGIERASFDLACDKTQLEVSALGNSSMGVRGCGKQARYVFVPDVGWVQDAAAASRSAE